MRPEKKNTQTGKEALKLSLFADTIISVQNYKESPKKCPELITEFIRAAGHRIKRQNLTYIPLEY